MRRLLTVICFLFAASAFASNGLIVHTTEFGVGKFHRYDNQVHPYGAQNAWAPYILAQNASTDKALTVKNADGSYTVFFSTLDEMMSSVVAISQATGKKSFGPQHSRARSTGRDVVSKRREHEKRLVMF